MKSFFALVIFLFCVMESNAQNVMDAVLFSHQNISGTARYKGINGAFGALGGDLSAINNNPAGSAIFNESTAAFTASLDAYNNDTYYFEGITGTQDSDLNFNQMGGVFVLNNSNNASSWRKLSFAVNYDRTADFDSEYSATGNAGNSVASYFLGNAQGFALSDLRLQGGEDITSAYRNIGEALGYQAQQGFLGFQSFIVEPVNDDPDNTEYFTTVGQGNFDQLFTHTSFGYAGKVSFNAAAQYGSRLYLGVNLNAHFIDYERNTVFFEDNSNSGSGVNSIVFRNNLRTLGNGFSLQAGAIYQLSPSWRIGATYDSPTWYGIDDETSQRLTTNGSNGNRVVAPEIVNVFETYNYRTPAKVSGSIAYIFENVGFLSFDYGYQDFSTINFKSNSVYDFSFQNNGINNELQAVTSYRLGGEYRAKQVSFRGGYRFEDSPYKDGFAMGDLTGFSLGLGYDFGNTRLDIAYARDMQDVNPQFYDGAFTNTAYIDHTTSIFLATLSFGL